MLAINYSVSVKKCIFFLYLFKWLCRNWSSYYTDPWAFFLIDLPTNEKAVFKLFKLKMQTWMHKNIFIPLTHIGVPPSTHSYPHSSDQYFVPSPEVSAGFTMPFCFFLSTFFFNQLGNSLFFIYTHLQEEVNFRELAC